VIATTRGAVLRGANDDIFGDPTDADTVVAGLSDIPLSVIEKDRREYDPATGTTRVVRELVGRVPAHLDIRDGDRIRDNRTGITYIIDEKERQPRSISGRASLTLSLRATGE
jgi:hypothetical protein